jgi:hypothetical protein
MRYGAHEGVRVFVLLIVNAVVGVGSVCVVVSAVVRHAVVPLAKHQRRLRRQWRLLQRLRRLMLLLRRWTSLVIWEGDD